MRYIALCEIQTEIQVTGKLSFSVVNCCQQISQWAELMNWINPEILFLKKHKIPLINSTIQLTHCIIDVIMQWISFLILLLRKNKSKHVNLTRSSIYPLVYGEQWGPFEALATLCASIRSLPSVVSHVVPKSWWTFEWLPTFRTAIWPLCREWKQKFSREMNMRVTPCVQMSNVSNGCLLYHVYYTM